MTGTRPSAPLAPSWRSLTVFLPALEGGGAERSLVTVAAELARRGRDVELVVADRRGNLRGQVPAHLRLVDLGRPHLRTCLPALVRHLRTRRPEALLATLEHGIVLAALAVALARVPTTLVPRLANTLSATPAPLPSRAGLTRVAAGPVYRRARVTVAVSRGAATDLARTVGVDPARIRVVPNPVVGPELFAGMREPLDHPWFAPGEPPVVLAVGRLTAQKNLPLLLEAFRDLCRGRRARLVVLGEGELRPELEERVRRLGLSGDVQLAGFDANPFRYMARAAAYVLCSDWEGLPGGLIQALACGAPVVATDCPSGPREILADGVHGRLVPPGDARALRQAIEDALTRGRRADAAAWLPYTVDRAVDAYARAIDEAVTVANRGRQRVRGTRRVGEVATP